MRTIQTSCTKEAKISRKCKIRSLIPVSWVNSCKWQFVCRYDAHTAQESVHCSGVKQSWNWR